MELETRFVDLVEQNELKYSNAMQDKMLGKSYNKNDFYNIHNNEKQLAIEQVTTKILGKQQWQVDR